MPIQASHPLRNPVMLELQELSSGLTEEKKSDESEQSSFSSFELLESDISNTQFIHIVEEIEARLFASQKDFTHWRRVAYRLVGIMCRKPMLGRKAVESVLGFLFRLPYCDLFLKEQLSCFLLEKLGKEQENDSACQTLVVHLVGYIKDSSSVKEMWSSGKLLLFISDAEVLHRKWFLRTLLEKIQEEPEFSLQGLVFLLENAPKLGVGSVREGLEMWALDHTLTVLKKQCSQANEYLNRFREKSDLARPLLWKIFSDIILIYNSKTLDQKQGIRYLLTLLKNDKIPLKYASPFAYKILDCSKEKRKIRTWINRILYRRGFPMLKISEAQVQRSLMRLQEQGKDWKVAIDFQEARIFTPLFQLCVLEDITAVTALQAGGKSILFGRIFHEESIPQSHRYRQYLGNCFRCIGEYATAAMRDPEQLSVVQRVFSNALKN